MNSKQLNRLRQILLALIVGVLLAFPAFAEEDTNPNSPTPILLSAPDSTRALAVQDGSKIGRGLPRAENNSFELYSKVVLYVTNIALMNGEGATAFRVYAEDSRNRQYRFPVVNLKLIDRQNRIYALVIELKDEIGYWEQPSGKGDILVSVAWRGLESNRVRLGLGATGGDIKDDAGAVPTPFSAKTNLPKSKEEVEAPNFVGYRWSGDRIRFLEQATFGPTPALDDRIRRIGLRTWLAEQFEIQYPSATNPYPDLVLKSTNSAVTTGDGCGHLPAGTELNDCVRTYYSMVPVQNWFYKEAFYGEPQLQHRVAWALSQIWVVSGVDTQQASWMTAYEQKIGKNAFGNWRQLMSDMTLNPAMGNYLDMRVSTRTNPNENYAREVLQLFNVGLFMLNQDGTRQLDGQGQPTPSYDQNTVNNFTKVLTGWNLCEVTGAQCPNRSTSGPNYKDPMIITNTNNHDLTAKTLFTYPGSTTTNLAACTNCTNAANITIYANNSLNQALDNIYNHPNTAPFVSRLLIQHLVTSDPTPAYVGRVAAVFTANRTSQTQMKEVVKAILLDPEARGDAKTDSRYGKLREPTQLLTNLARQFDARSADRAVLSDGTVTTPTSTMGQAAFLSPTVFNFYPPDYAVPGTTLNGPEFAIFTTGTSIARANFVNTMVFNRINPNTNTQPYPFVSVGTSLSFADLQALATTDTTGNQLMDALNTRMMHGAMSAQMRSTILTAVLAVASTNPLLRAQTAVYLTVTSSQYQVQR